MSASRNTLAHFLITIVSACPPYVKRRQKPGIPKTPGSVLPALFDLLFAFAVSGRFSPELSVPGPYFAGLGLEFPTCALFSSSKVAR